LLLFLHWHATFQQFYVTFHNLPSRLRLYPHPEISGLYYKWFIQIRFSLLQTRAAWNFNVLRHQTDMLGSRFLLQGSSLSPKNHATLNCLTKPTIF
jgi:hypothetical protein